MKREDIIAVRVAIRRRIQRDGYLHIQHEGRPATHGGHGGLSLELHYPDELEYVIRHRGVKRASKLG